MHKNITGTMKNPIAGINYGQTVDVVKMTPGYAYVLVKPHGEDRIELVPRWALFLDGRDANRNQ